MRAGRISGEHYAGRWHNLGTPQELATLEAQLRER
jgi:MurNAc alpha-1-phosphate uridylyltransferase